MAREKHMFETEESYQPEGFCECLAGKAFSRGTCETFYLEDF